MKQTAEEEMRDVGAGRAGPGRAQSRPSASVSYNLGAEQRINIPSSFSASGLKLTTRLSVMASARANQNARLGYKGVGPV